MKKQIKQPKSIKNKMIIPLAFNQIDFDWEIYLVTRPFWQKSLKSFIFRSKFEYWIDPMIKWYISRFILRFSLTIPGTVIEF